MTRARVVLAEDHSETRELLSHLLESEFDVIARVPDGRALVAAADELLPDIVVTDISMPGLDGIAAATAIHRDHPDTRIVFVSVHNDPSVIRCGFDAGASGYVLKTTAGDELITAVHAALRGEQHVSQVLNYTESKKRTQ